MIHRSTLCPHDGCASAVLTLTAFNDETNHYQEVTVLASPWLPPAGGMRPSQLYGKVLVPDSVATPAVIVSQYDTLGELPEGTIHRVHNHKET